jgi:cell division protein FtsL
MKKVLLFLLVLLVAAGVWIWYQRRAATEERREETERQTRMKEAVSVIASRHNARIGWEKRLMEENELKKPFTFQVEDALVREGRPIKPSP